jgi:hypothetical protein
MAVVVFVSLACSRCAKASKPDQLFGAIGLAGRPACCGRAKQLPRSPGLGIFEPLIFGDGLLHLLKYSGQETQIDSSLMARQAELLTFDRESSYSTTDISFSFTLS